MSASAVPTRPLPDPLCRFYRHPIRWTIQRAQQVLYLGIGAYVGMLIIVALYYLILETTPTMKNAWHGLVPNSDIRHTIRNVGEGLLGGLLAQQIIWNHYKKSAWKKMHKPPTRLDRAEMKLRIPNIKDGKPFSLGRLFATVPLVLLYALPGGVIGFLIVHGVQGMHLNFGSPVATNPTTAHLADKMKATWTQAWPKKLIGYFAAFVFGRRPAKAVFDDVQLLFAERRAALGQSLRWYHPANFKARVNAIREGEEQGEGTYAARGVWLTRVVLALLPISIGLAGFGWWVLAYRA